MTIAVIVGDRGDPHVDAVVQSIEPDVEVVVFDAPELVRAGYEVRLDEARIGNQSVPYTMISGWLRRYAPDTWGAGEKIGSVDAVARQACLRLLASLSRLSPMAWLTSLDDLLAAEDRLHQLAVAQRLGIRVPSTVVTSDPRVAEARLGPEFVLKPLSSGWYRDETGHPRAVFAQSVTTDALSGVDFGSAPFVAQERITAVTHLRFVTVGDHCWVAQLDADNLPLDWRSDDEAHQAWTVDDVSFDKSGAMKLASAMNVGYSSQDWILDDSGEFVFLDLNPAGQWLFLPDAIASEVTAAVATFLSTIGGRDR